MACVVVCFEGPGWSCLASSIFYQCCIYMIEIVCKCDSSGIFIEGTLSVENKVDTGLAPPFCHQWPLEVLQTQESATKAIPFQLSFTFVPFRGYNSKRPCNDLGRIVVAVVVISIIVLVIIIIVIIIIISIMYLSLYLNKKSVWVYRAVYHQVQSLNEICICSICVYWKYMLFEVLYHPIFR